MGQSAASLQPDPDLGDGLIAARDALRNLTRARRRNRAKGVDVFEGFYQAYLTAFACGIAILLGSDAIGDVRATPEQVSSLVAHAPAYIGLGLSLIVLVALRSGGRGGPLVLPAADVRHVLLAPVSRRDALRHPAVRQIRFSAFVGMVAGAALGTVAARRLPGGVPEWAPLGGAVGAMIGTLIAALGLVVCGRRIRPWIATLMGLAIVGWSGADVAFGRLTSPLSLIGELALSPLKSRPAALGVVALPAVLVAAAIAGIGGLSLEQAERRATLASQIRFALTLQDLRTVVLLRRQLTQEQSRTRPWIGLGPVAGGRNTVLSRDLRGLTRWPSVRVLRVMFLGVAAGASLAGAWDGTTPLLLAGALCLFLAGLDALEPLAQDIDHPDLPASVPLGRGDLRARHAPVPLLIMGIVALVAWGTSVAIAAVGGFPVDTAVSVGGVLVLPAALLGMVGAAASVVMEPSVGGGDLMPAEIAGVKMVVRAIWSPALVLLGLTPLLVARNAARHHLSPGQAAFSASILPLMVGVFGLAWLRFREEMHEYLKPPPKGSP